MGKTITWRKATDKEISQGSPEMIKVAEEDTPDVIPDKVKQDMSNADVDSLTDDQLTKLASKLKSKLNKTP